MKEIIKLILKYHFTIIFILLEVLSFSLIVLHNNYQRTVFSGYTASFFGTISSVVTRVDDYFYLKVTNEKLVAENTELRNEIEKLKLLNRISNADTLWAPTDSADVDYVYKTAEMINSSFNKTKNYIVIDKGATEGIKPEMAVCSSEGVVGIIEKIKKNGYYGSLQWDGDDYRYSYLNDIPFHVDTEVGDTIVTSGFSSIFPEGEMIGFVESVNKETANFLTIKVKLATDFKRISDVYIIANTRKEEQQALGRENHE